MLPMLTESKITKQSEILTKYNLLNCWNLKCVCTFEKSNLSVSILSNYITNENIARIDGHKIMFLTQRTFSIKQMRRSTFISN